MGVADDNLGKNVIYSNTIEFENGKSKALCKTEKRANNAWIGREKFCLLHEKIRGFTISTNTGLGTVQ